jgi:tRNA (adenine22-N1)-methyltransferase
MGGELVLHILTDGEAVCRSAKELILQPQSEIAGVRRYLREHAYRIVAENMIYEDGKYYPMMRVVPVAENEPHDAEMSAFGNETCSLYDLYGELLLKAKHPVLRQYLIYQENLLNDILDGLRRQPDTDKIRIRIGEIEKKLYDNRMAQHMV